MENADLKYIKKHYGEKMAHLCRELFPTLLETPGLLSSALEKSFAHTTSLAEDIIRTGKQNEFRTYIYSLVDVKKEVPTISEPKTPEQLLDEAGYILYPECKTEDDIQSFKHYYAKGEKLCTFNGKRLNSCRVWFAVKKNVDQIKREDFDVPERQDEYGTSVISIQFSKDEKNWLSIKNRYNHAVENPDATFSNNLDNIIFGLSSAFASTYDIRLNEHQSHGFDLDNYVLANDGKYYRYNNEVYGVYYCENNYIVQQNGNPKKLDPARYILMDYFVVDMAKGSQSVRAEVKDAFTESIGQIESISVERDEDKNKVVCFKVKDGEDVLITLNKKNQIIKVDNKNITSVGNYYLYACENIEKVNLPSLTSADNYFMMSNSSLPEINLSSLESIGNDFFYWSNIGIKHLDLPALTTVGDNFLYRNMSLKTINAPKLTSVGDCFLNNNNSLKELDFPSLKTTGNYFLFANGSLDRLNAPLLYKVGCDFLRNNPRLVRVDLPLLESCGDNFFTQNLCATEINLPSLKSVGDGFFLLNANSIKQLYLPQLCDVGSDFLYFNYTIDRLHMPMLARVGDSFLKSNTSLTELNLPSTTSVGDEFILSNNTISVLNMPSLKSVGKYFLCNGKNISKISSNFKTLDGLNDRFLSKIINATIITNKNTDKSMS